MPRFLCSSTTLKATPTPNARTLMSAAKQRGWHAVVPHFRSCSGPMNLFPRFYHFSDSAEVD